MKNNCAVKKIKSGIGHNSNQKKNPLLVFCVSIRYFNRKIFLNEDLKRQHNPGKKTAERLPVVVPHSYPWSSRVWSSRAHCRGPHLIGLGASSSSFFVLSFCYIFWPDCHCWSLCSTFISWGSVVLPFPLCHWSYSASCPSFITSSGSTSHLWLGIRSGNCVAIVAFF